MQTNVIRSLSVILAWIMLTGVQAQPVNDADGNAYKTITIGSQVWMAENLRTTRYADGSAIPQVAGDEAWATSSSPAFCWYQNDSAANAVRYGALYNWYAVDAAANGNKSICPPGWRIPTDEDWNILAHYLADNGYAFEGERRDLAKALAAASGWKAHDIIGNVGHDQTSNNSSGFTALPGGYRNFLGKYNHAGAYAYWWTATEFSATNAWYRFIHNYYSYLGRNNFKKQNGFSIRCVREAASAAQSPAARQIRNPYEHVDWSKYGQYKANLNAHTLASNGWMNPQSVVEAYKNLGYSVLAITDKHLVTYPWNEFSRFRTSKLSFSRIYHIVPIPFEDHSIPLQDTLFIGVDPSGTGMVAIRGCALLYDKHSANIYFSELDSSEGNVPDAIASKNGLAVLNHPGLQKFPVSWYTGLFERYQHLQGIEIFNSNARFLPLLQTWDSVQTALAPVRPVWGFANDDFYSKRDLGKNWNVFLLPALNEGEVRSAMEKGAFYLVHAPQGVKGPQPPVIRSITVNREKGTIRVESNGQQSTVWTSGGTKFGEGEVFLLEDLPANRKYVRAEIHGAGNAVVCTQPFFVK
ncbi:MAG: fibrobacter succinogenes major paralogous domain-containing protein [Mangrovibacterium sp.]|nr:fibrobacter succinogenes major paralogous domain-containing protein [Mangrovibacterium sp.]